MKPAHRRLAGNHFVVTRSVDSLTSPKFISSILSLSPTSIRSTSWFLSRHGSIRTPTCGSVSALDGRNESYMPYECSTNYVGTGLPASQVEGKGLRWGFSGAQLSGPRSAFSTSFKPSLYCLGSKGYICS